MLLPDEWEGGRNILGFSGWSVELIEPLKTKRGTPLRVFHMMRTKKAPSRVKCNRPECPENSLGKNGWEQIPPGRPAYHDRRRPRSTKSKSKKTGSQAKWRIGVVIADVPSFGGATKIVAYRQRLICKTCLAEFVEPLPAYMDAPGGMTARCNVYVRHEATNRSFSTIAREIDIDEGVVRGIVKTSFGLAHFKRRQPKRIPNADWIVPPRYLGLDEISMIDRSKPDGAHRRRPRATLVNIESGAVLNVLTSNTTRTIETGIKALGPNRHDHIRAVVIDMHEGYAALVKKALPNAVLIIDRFHVEAAAQKAADKVRIEEARTRASRKKGRRSSTPSRIPQNENVRMFARLLRRKLMPRSPARRDTLREYLRGHPRTMAAFKARQEFGLIFDKAENATQAADLYHAWRDGLDADMQKVFANLIGRFNKLGRAIFAYADFRVTNGPTESANSAMRKIIRSGPQIHIETLREKVRARARITVQRKFICDTCHQRSDIEPERHVNLRGDLQCKACWTGEPAQLRQTTRRWTMVDLFACEADDLIELSKTPSRKDRKEAIGQQLDISLANAAQPLPLQQTLAFGPK